MTRPTGGLQSFGVGATAHRSDPGVLVRQLPGAAWERLTDQQRAHDLASGREVARRELVDHRSGDRPVDEHESPLRP